MPLTAKVKIIQDVPVRYFDSKPFSRKIEVSKIQGPLPSNLIKEIEKLLSSENITPDVKAKWEKIQEVSSNSANAKSQGESQDSQSKFAELSKAENSLYVFHFTKHFKHPTARGRLVYALTFWNPFELIDNVGQMHGFFLDPPFQIIVPKTKDEWVKDMMNEMVAKGKSVTKKDVAFFKKTYKRFVDQRKWINVIFIPTWTLDGVLSIHSRVSGIQSVTETLVKTKQEFAEVFPQFAVMKDTVDSQGAVLSATHAEIHKLGDKLRTANQAIDESRRNEIDKSVPIIIPPGSKDYPQLTPSAPVESKPTASERLGLEGISKEDILNAIPIFFGLFLVSGFAANPIQLIGVGILGTILLISGIVLFVWRKRLAVSMPESVKKKVEEAKETMQEHVRGP
jgi:hypothetical protein